MKSLAETDTAVKVFAFSYLTFMDMCIYICIFELRNRSAVRICICIFASMLQVFVILYMYFTLQTISI